MTASPPIDLEAKRRGRIWLALYAVYLVITAYWALTPAGPGLWLARAQSAMFGGFYSMKLTMLLLHVPVAVVALWGPSKSSTPTTERRVRR